MAHSKSQATRGGGPRPLPFYVWLLTGVVLGLGLAGVAMYRDWVPALRGGEGPQPNPQAAAVRGSDPGVAAEAAKPAETRPRFDFYTVLPEMETVVPDAQIAAEAAQPAPDSPTATSDARLFLQAGSFRSPADADQLKARLALLGQRAAVVAVTVNGATWHRVRVGPFASARELDEARRALAESGIEAMALRAAR
ncbi:MAG: SPOR domain-containing protein [Pseudomonadota bacterium]